MKVFLTNLQKPLVQHQTRICSIKDVCKGLPLLNNRDNFYPGQSGCIGCMRKKSKEKWDEKKKQRENLFI